MFILIYVDDIIVTGNSSSKVNLLIQQLNEAFALKNMGSLHYFLGIEVIPTTTEGLLLSKSKYIQDMLQKANMTDCKPYPTLTTANLHLFAIGSVPFDDPNLYKSVVGSLQYITIIRLELAFCVNKVCQYMQNPLEVHWKAVKHILRYLCGTQHFGLHTSKSPQLHLTGFIDSD